EGGEQLQPPVERREQRDLVAEHLPRVRVERHDRRPGARLDCCAHDGLVADVDTVERPDRDGARLAPELPRAVCDLHRPPAAASASAPAASTRSRTPAGTRATAWAGSRPSASATESQRSGAASSTPKGPTAVRRSVRQWPPSAS